MLTSTEKQNHFNFILGLVAITTFFAVGGMHVRHMPENQYSAGRWVTHTHETLNQLETLSRNLNKAEADYRGYVMTGNAEYLAETRLSVLAIKKSVNRFQYLTQDNPHQQTRIPLLQKNIDAKVAEIEQAVKDAKLQPSSSSAKNMQHASLSNQIDEQIEGMKEEENSLLQERLQEWYAKAGNTQKFFMYGGILLYLLICLTCGTLYVVAVQRSRFSIAEHKKAELLEKVVGAQRKIVGHSGSMQDTLQIIADRTKELIDAEGCVVEMLDHEEIVYAAGSGSGAPHIGLRLKIEGSFSGLCVQKNEILICNDSETDSRVNKEACRKVGLRSMVVVPLHHRETNIGVLKVMSSKVSAFSKEDIIKLELMAGLLSAALNDAIVTNTVRQNNMELSAANIDLEKLATTDGLTDLQNRRTFQKFLSRECDLATRHKRKLSLLLLDVDFFKSFNDNFGHPAGDAVLKQMGVLLKQAARTTDCVSRYGGEEFAVLLSETGANESMIVANRIQQLIAENPWEHRAVTVSIGISSLSEDISSPDALLEFADKALYTAKETGRNRIVEYKPGA